MPQGKPRRSAEMPTDVRRRTMVCAYANGGLWGLASGLASTTLVIYLVKEYGASGGDVSWLLAAPALAGMLRLFTPQLLERVKSRRWFCVATFLSSALVLLALPILSAPEVLPSQRMSITFLILTWVGYHVLEYLGVVSLWSWFGDLVPERIRGRFISRRVAWMNVGKILGMVIAAVSIHLWMNHCDAISQIGKKWLAYAGCSLAGGVFAGLATIPLMQMVDLPLHRDQDYVRESLWEQLVSPLADKKFRRLLSFGAWFSFSNGLFQSAHSMYQTGVLGMTFVQKKVLDSSSRAMQVQLMPAVGRWVDRHGNVRVLAFSQGLIAMAPLFFLLSRPEAKWWIVGAYVCWVAYAGENITQPNLMLGLSPADETVSYASAWFAWTQLSYALSVLAGGVLYDWMAKNFESVQFGSFEINYLFVLFSASMILKLLGVHWAVRIRE